MAPNNGNDPATHLGRQMKRDRLAHGWSIREFGALSKTHIGTLSNVENGKRPMTEKLAAKCDELFPERRGWYSEFYEESKSWVPAGFRSWAEYEDKAVTLRAWSPSFLHGLLQIEPYARAQLETAIGATPEMIATRLAARMARQQRVLYRDNPPKAWFVVDEASLYRLVGSPKVMAAQMGHLLTVAALPHVVIQLLPAVAHPAGASGFIVTDQAAYAEHVAGGFTYAEGETFIGLERLMTTILSESRRASDTRSIIGKLEETWNRLGESQPTRMRTVATASK